MGGLGLKKIGPSHPYSSAQIEKRSDSETTTEWESPAQFETKWKEHTIVAYNQKVLAVENNFR